MKRILVDLDAVVADLIPQWLEFYNTDYDDHLSVSDIKSWGIHEYVKPECGTEIYAYLEYPDLYAQVKPIDGAISSIHWLSQHAYDVRFVSSGVYEGKYKWLHKYGLLRGDNPRYSPDLVIAHDKSLIIGDIMIDDNPNNLNEFRGKGILFAQPWNDNTITPCFRADGWPDVIQYLARGI